MSIGVSMNELGMGDAAYQSQRCNQVAVDRPESGVVLATTGNRIRRKDSATLGYIHGWLAVLADVGEDDFVFGHNGIHMIDVAREKFLQQERRLLVPQLIEQWPKFLRSMDFLDPNG